MRAGSKLSLAYIRSRAQQNMRSSCQIERIQRPAWSEASYNASSSGSRVTIYTGECRLWETSGAAEVAVAGTDLVMQTAQLSIPWYVDPIPQRDDEVEITYSETDSSLVGTRFRIIDVHKAGDLRPSRRFTVVRIQPHGDWP